MFISMGSNGRAPAKRPAAKKSRAAQERPTLRPSIENFMTSVPRSIGASQTLTAAHAMMRKYGVRHLPVMDDGKLVGVVSQRDLYFVETLLDAAPESARVRDAMSTDIFTVDRKARLDHVARTMGRRKLGCAIVVEDGEVLGLFTTIDALAALAHYVSR